MEFGMPTLIELKSLESGVALCHEMGLQFIEFNMNLPEFQVEQLDLMRLTKIAKEYGIYYTIHLDENLNPCDFNEKVAHAYTETVLQAINIAKELSIPVLNMHMHPGVYFTLPDKKIYLLKEYEHEYHEKLMAFRQTCEKVIGDTEIKICIENCGEYRDKPYITKGLEILLDSPVFALTVDVGHNASAQYGDEPTIMAHEDRLFHMHLHDAIGQQNHMVLGTGNVSLLKYIDLAKKHHCRVVIEVKTVEGLRASVTWLKERRIL